MNEFIDSSLWLPDECLLGGFFSFRKTCHGLILSSSKCKWNETRQNESPPFFFCFLQEPNLSPQQEQPGWRGQWGKRCGETYHSATDTDSPNSSKGPAKPQVDGRNTVEEQQWREEVLAPRWYSKRETYCVLFIFYKACMGTLQIPRTSEASSGISAITQLIQNRRPTQLFIAKSPNAA